MSDTAAYRTTLSRVPPEEGGYYVLAYPEIPGCLGAGDTEAEAIEDDRPPPEARGASE